MKKTIKILLICIFIITTIQSTSLAAGSIDTDYQIGSTTAVHASDDMISNILGYIQTIGSIISVVALAIIGLRYMFSSIDEQAKLKGILIYYVIGAVLVFATSNIIGVLYDVIGGVSY